MATTRHPGGRPAKPEADKAVKISVSFEPGQLSDVLTYCQRNDRSISWIVRKALDQWLSVHKDDVEGE